MFRWNGVSVAPFFGAFAVERFMLDIITPFLALAPYLVILVALAAIPPHGVEGGD